RGTLVCRRALPSPCGTARLPARSRPGSNRARRVIYPTGGVRSAGRSAADAGPTTWHVAGACCAENDSRPGAATASSRDGHLRRNPRGCGDARLRRRPGVDSALPDQPGHAFCGARARGPTSELAPTCGGDRSGGRPDGGLLKHLATHWTPGPTDHATIPDLRPTVDSSSLLVLLAC